MVLLFWPQQPALSPWKEEQSTSPTENLWMKKICIAKFDILVQMLINVVWCDLLQTNTAASAQDDPSSKDSRAVGFQPDGSQKD